MPLTFLWRVKYVYKQGSEAKLSMNYWQSTPCICCWHSSHLVTVYETCLVKTNLYCASVLVQYHMHFSALTPLPFTARTSEFNQNKHRVWSLSTEVPLLKCGESQQTFPPRLWLFNCHAGGGCRWIILRPNQKRTTGTPAYNVWTDTRRNPATM